MGSLVNYIRDSFEELRDHVKWTPLQELQKMTLVVVVFSVKIMRFLPLKIYSFIWRKLGNF